MQGVHTKIDQYTDDGVYIQTWKNASEASRMLGFASTNITRVLDHPTRRVAGYMWKTSYFNVQAGADRFTMHYVPTEEQHYEFNRRIVRYLPIFFNLMKKYPFITPSNMDDFLQEALIMAWRKYDSVKHYEGDGAYFGGWCRAIFKYAILNYQAILTRKELRFKVEPDDRMAAEEEEDDSMAYVLALYHFLDAMTEEDRKVVMAYVECKNEKEMLDRTGYGKAKFWRHLKQLFFLLKHRIKYYLHGIQESKEAIEPIKKSGRGKAIEQFDMKGNFIARYDRVQDVEENGFSPAGVSGVIHQARGSHKGYLWRFAKNCRNIEVSDCAA